MKTSPSPAPRWSSLLIVATSLVVGLAPVRATSSGWRHPAISRSLIATFGPEFLAADTLRPEERGFLERAADATRTQMRMAQLAVAQAVDSNVRSLAQTLAADQRDLNDAIDALRRRKGIEAPASREVAVDNYQQLATKSGADFDRAFVRQMAEAQRATLNLFERALADAKDADVRDLIGSYLPVLRDHDNRLVELQKTLP